MNYKKYFQWIAFLPASFIAGLLATFPLHWLLYYLAFAESTPDTGSIRFLGKFFIDRQNVNAIEHFLSPLLLMTVFVLVAYNLAPAHKLKASFSVVLLWTLFMVSSIIYMPERIFFDTRTLATLIVMLVALYFNWRKSIRSLN